MNFISPKAARDTVDENRKKAFELQIVQLKSAFMKALETTEEHFVKLEGLEKYKLKAIEEFGRQMDLLGYKVVLKNNILYIQFYDPTAASSFIFETE